MPDIDHGDVRGFHVLVHDVSELTENRLRLAAAVRENEELLRTLDMHSMVSITDDKGFITHVNENFCRFLGYRQDEVLGRPHSIINSGVQNREFWTHMWDMIATGQPWRGEICNRGKDGTLHWIDSIIAPFLGKDGRVHKYVSIGTDITAAKATEQKLLQDVAARKSAEAKLRESNERFVLAADSAGIGVWEHSITGGKLVWDDWMYRIYGMERTAEPLRYSSWIDALHPDDRPRIEALIAAANRGPDDFNTEYRIIRPDGDVRNIKAASHAIRGVDGASVSTTGVNFDVTDARQREAVARRETASLLRTVLDAASEVSIIATDESLTIKVFSAGAEKMLGLSSGEAVGRQLMSRIHELPDEEAPDKTLSIETKQSLDVRDAMIESSLLGHPQEFTFFRKNGSRITVSLLLTPTRSDEGPILGYVCVGHDITQQRLDETALLQAKARAESANSAKAAFLANMSHEIRSPMNAVIGLAYLLRHTSLTAEQADFLSKIQTASNSLLSLINDVLDLSKIEANELLVESVVFSLPELLRDVATEMKVQADAKGIEFNIDSSSDVPESLIGDPMRLRQILINLLSNAVRFTNSGGVRIATKRIPDTAGPVSLSFVISDSGIGIAPDVQQGLFAPFAQADSSIARRYGGTGLGLCIVKQLTKLLGGTVSLDSTMGVGSAFTVVLPFATAAGDALRASREAAVQWEHRTLRGVRALVVDDSEINLEVARRILELDGMRVSLALDGQKAIELLQAEPRGFDIVFMDLQMPGVDGYEATRRIRVDLELLDLPIIAVSAGALSSERQRAHDAGMNDFICKPFDGPLLARVVLRHGRRENLQPAPPDAAEAAELLGGTWPVIEGIDTADARARWCGDAPLFVSMLARMLEDFGPMNVPAPGHDAVSIMLHAGRLHKLRGGAVLLGAKAVSLLAGQAEAACERGDYDAAARFTEMLTIEMRNLIENARPVLAVAQRRNEISAASSAALDAQVVDEFRGLLMQQSLDAIDLFRSLSPQLKRVMGADLYEEMRVHMDNLQFDQASQVLMRSRLFQTPGVTKGDGP